MAQDMAATWEAIDSLQPWPHNPRKISPDIIARITESIARFGFAAPIVARQQDRRIIAGHVRWHAARELGMEQVPVRFLALDEDQANALALLDNRSTALTPWDMPMLSDVLRDLQAHEIPIEALGWSAVELEEILAAEQEHLSAAEHWQQADLTPCENTSTVYQKVTVNFLDTEAVEAFFTLIGQAYTAHTNSIWFPPRLQRDLKHQRWAGDVS